MSYSALPEANRAGCPGKRLVGNRLRNSCSMHGPMRLRQRGT